MYCEKCHAEHLTRQVKDFAVATYGCDAWEPRYVGYYCREYCKHMDELERRAEQYCAHLEEMTKRAEEKQTVAVA